ncbi:MAG: disulfide bond formation protein DsbA [Actinobacteria bacterium]|nr:disulfide bond formation protein DsbA [Actinomycetota bacterium]
MPELLPVTFHFDPACPWAWMTSRWMSEVAEHRDLDLTWALMSLRYLNEDRDIDQGYRDFIATRQDLSGAIAAAVLRDGPQVAAPLYTAIGTRAHPQGRRDYDAIIADAFAEAAVTPVSQAEIDADATQALLREGTAAVIAKVGEDVGTPTIDIDGAAMFGPVVTPAPKGQAALDLWDGLVLVTRTPGFYELKRSRTDDPIFD